MSKPTKPVRQDYIAKARYINNLPPPPLNPKFLKYNITEGVSTEEENQQLLSSLFRKENFTRFIGQIDEEYGMPLNLLHNQGFLDGSDPRAIYGQEMNVPLHPKDKMLLRDAGIGRVNKSEPGVSFLRRTEYIAERQASIGDDRQQKAVGKDADEKLDPESQLAAVEESFDKAQETLADLPKLKHPRRKNLKAVSAWPLLPDTSMMDTKFLGMKFSGSASLSRELASLQRIQKEKYDEQLQKDSIKHALYIPITSEDGEWISFYQLKDRKGLDNLKEKMESLDREQPGNLLDEEDDSADAYQFKLFKNYDMHYHRFSKPYEELALKFVPKEPGSKKRSAAYYYPISGRVDLKKHRASANSEINRFIEDSTVDVVNFKLREPNTNELRKMDVIRSEYDPMEYEGEDDDDDEEEEEDNGGEEEGGNEDCSNEASTREESTAPKEEDGTASGDIADEFDKATEAENGEDSS